MEDQTVLVIAYIMVILEDHYSLQSRHEQHLRIASMFSATSAGSPGNQYLNPDYLSPLQSEVSCVEAIHRHSCRNV